MAGMNIHDSMRLREMLPSSSSFWVADLWSKMEANDAGPVQVFDGGTGAHLGSVMVGGCVPGTVVAERAPELGESGSHVYASAELHLG